MVIKVNQLEYTYPINHQVLSDLSFEVQRGDFWGILGKNGAGKTTLIDLLLGIKHPTQGTISILGKSPNNPEGNHQENIAFISQDISLKGKITINEFLTFHSAFFKKYSKEIEQELIDYFDVDRSTLIGSLSTGQQKKAQIIAGLAADTEIILIDEITAVLDPSTRYRFFNKILEFNKERKKTIMLATNIAEDLKERTNKILYINNKNGEILQPSQISSIFKTK